MFIKQTLNGGGFVYMAKKYFPTKHINIIDRSTLYYNFIKKTHTLKPLLVDKTIPDLGVLNTKGKFNFIHELNKDFNIIFFYLPSCGHCKEAAPKLKAFYDSHKNESISIMPISTEESEADWLKFINDYQWQDFTNGYGAVVSRNVNYSKDYDVKTTPTIYVIDKTHKIIARRIGINDIEPFYKLYQKQNK
ncbi:TlpA disulfide reductase family protein [Runella sp. MFBS21]|uniref:TlpA family protein disulfide reductase n=1 Tax=Runella sp. MFBS21 TaxID=3034018 RepID=UPI0023F80113|nr:TlpA disulfide reductase family protein [Runella sp. MFBS21]MDF7818669.1 TlpA disulfide reductase family protein [Runella sp. MFBS21]